MRYFKDRINMGQGNQSKRAVAFLRSRFELAISSLSGQQQGETTKDQDLELEDVVHDIYSALSGREVAIATRVAYDPESVQVPDDFEPPITISIVFDEQNNIKTEDALFDLIRDGLKYRKLAKDILEKLCEQHPSSMAAHFVVSKEDYASFNGEG